MFRSMGSSTGSIPSSMAFAWRTDTLSSTTIRRNEGSRQASRKVDRPARTASQGDDWAAAASTTAATTSASTAS